MATVLVVHVAALGVIFGAERVAAVVDNQTSGTTVAIKETIGSEAL
jgi:hypothetical protein